MTQPNSIRADLSEAGGRRRSRAHVLNLKGGSEAEFYAVCKAHSDTAQAAIAIRVMLIQGGPLASLVVASHRRRATSGQLGSCLNMDLLGALVWEVLNGEPREKRISIHDS